MQERILPNPEQYADLLHERFSSGILAELQPYDHFVTWKIISQEGKPKKLPFNPHTHTPASSTNPDTWASLEESLQALRTGKYNGIGFVFADDDPFTGIDLDNCVLNNTCTPEARELITQFDSYTERSPSRTGIHIIIAGTIPEGRRRNGIEVYSTGRYFTLTTNHVKGSHDTIEERQSQLDIFYASLTPLKAPQQAIAPQEHQIYVSDEKVLEKAQNARNGDNFKNLYAGNSAGFTSKSEADFTLVLLLLYWTNDDIAQVERLFRQSGLYDEKTDRPTQGMTYLAYTIQKAIEKRR